MDLTDPTSERLKRLLRYWQSIAGDTDIPERAAFSPTDVPPEDLPYVILLDVHGGGTDFSYRLVGSGVVGFVGHEFTGNSISDYQHLHEPPEMRDAYVLAVQERRPTLYEGTLERFDKEYVRYERLALPLAEQSAERPVIQILAVFEFEYANPNMIGTRSSLWPNAV